MRRLLVAALLVVSYLSLFVSVQAKDNKIYCDKYYDSYRDIAYWATPFLSIINFHHNSGDAEWLGLRIPVPGRRGKFLGNPNDNLSKHYRAEFVRLVKGNLTFHDTKQYLERKRREFIIKHIDDDNFTDKLRGLQESLIRATWGPNPGVVGCWIKVKRREFPVIYLIKCQINANKSLWWYPEGLVFKDMGFGLPDTIEQEMKVSLTEILTKVRDRLQKIRKCPNQ